MFLARCVKLYAKGVVLFRVYLSPQSKVFRRLLMLSLFLIVSHYVSMLVPPVVLTLGGIRSVDIPRLCLLEWPRRYHIASVSPLASDQ